MGECVGSDCGIPAHDKQLVEALVPHEPPREKRARRNRREQRRIEILERRRWSMGRRRCTLMRLLMLACTPGRVLHQRVAVKVSHAANKVAECGAGGGNVGARVRAPAQPKRPLKALVKLRHPRFDGGDERVSFEGSPAVLKGALSAAVGRIKRHVPSLDFKGYLHLHLHNNHRRVRGVARHGAVGKHGLSFRPICIHERPRDCRGEVVGVTRVQRSKVGCMAGGPHRSDLKFKGTHGRRSTAHTDAAVSKAVDRQCRSTLVAEIQKDVCILPALHRPFGILGPCSPHTKYTQSPVARAFLTLHKVRRQVHVRIVYCLPSEC
eukprot:Opistho-2@4609